MSNENDKIGIMGGSFDPVHNGHLLAASEALYAFSLKKIIFLPSFNLEYKQYKASSKDRYRMVSLAIKDNRCFEISDFEILGGHNSYTIDSLKYFSAKYKNSKLFFITGADIFQNVDIWKNADELGKYASFIAVSRPGHSFKKLDLNIDIHLLKIPALSISSSLIRDKLKAGEPINYLIPKNVLKYIKKHNLYI